MTTAFPARGAGLLGGAFFVAVFIVFSLRSDSFVHGDIHTDSRAVIGAEQFRLHGVAALLNTQTVDGRAEFGLRPSYYPRHPSGGVIALSWLRDQGFGYPAARFLPLLATTLGLLGFAACCFRISGEARFALIAGTAYAVFAPHYLLADSFQLYSYALFAKGVGAWCIAEAAAARGRRRLLFATGAAASAFSGVAFFGLETMPALGLLSVVVPAISFAGGLRSRLVATVVVAGATGAGMVAGVAYRVSVMAPIFGDSRSAALEHLAASTASRSFRAIETGLSGLDYVLEVGGRIWAYAPVHLIVAALGAVVVLTLGRNRGEGPSSRFWIRAAAVFALAELPYFILMRRHVALHAHTTAHLGFAAAGLAACGFSAVDERFRSPRARRAVAVVGASAVVLSLGVSPLVVKGNLSARDQVAAFVRADRDARDILAAAPRDAVLYVAPQERDWPLREAASRDGRSFVVSDDLRRPRDIADDVAYIASVTSRPVFAVVSARPEDPELARYAARGIRVADNRRHVLFAVEHAAPEPMPRERLRELPGPVFASAKLVAPSAEAIAAAKLDHPLFRFSDGALWMHAAPPSLGAATSVEMQWPSATETAMLVVAEFLYKPAGTQPKLELEIMATSAGTRGSAARHAGVFRPSEEPQTLELYLPSKTSPTGLSFRLALAEGETRETAARLIVRRVRVVPAVFAR